MQAVFDCSLKSKLGKAHERPAPAQHANDDLFAPSRGKDGHADIEAIGLFRCDVPILRKAALAHIELRQNFDPDDEVFVHPSRNFKGFAENAIDAIAHSGRALIRLDLRVGPG